MTVGTGRRSRIFQRKVVMLLAVKDAARLSRSRRPSASIVLFGTLDELDQNFIRNVTPLIGGLCDDRSAMDDASIGQSAATD